MDRYQEVYEINLIYLIFYCLKRWRWIVVGMVFMAVVSGVYKYQSTITDNQLKKEKQLQQVVTEQIEGETESERIVFEDPVSSAGVFSILGMVGGICIVCVVFCMSYIMGGKLQDVEYFSNQNGYAVI